MPFKAPDKGPALLTQPSHTHGKDEKSSAETKLHNVGILVMKTWVANKGRLLYIVFLFYDYEPTFMNGMKLCK